MLAIATAHDLELRLSKDHALVAAAQGLRYRVFYEEMGAVADPATRAARLDVDPFDALADHLLVLDRNRSTPETPCVVGCYRLLRGSVAAAAGGFYSSAEFDRWVFG